MSSVEPQEKLGLPRYMKEVDQWWHVLDSCKAMDVIDSCKAMDVIADPSPTTAVFVL